ncbi:hypothetical protein SASPL_126546 [Salvia splendens]|uniref:3'-5' exonuclease domain-containing protein n=2 Tax=Salvia splendens TaxID=180675 RepID=A0A8X8ZR93_SALSN|nr:hypothetical protein SASPL_126546 [Salvia splendens]
MDSSSSNTLSRRSTPPLATLTASAPLSPLPLPPPQLLSRGGARRPVVGPRPRRHAPALRAAQLPHLPAVGELVDVREPAHELRGCRLGASMGELADEVLGIYWMGKDNAVGRSDWEDEDLTWEQVEYACHDVFLSYLITIFMD